MTSWFAMIRHELFSFSAIASIFCIALFYAMAALLLPNASLLITTITGPFSLGYKLTLFISLLGGFWTAESPLDSILLLLSSILIGANFYFLGKTIYLLRHSKKIKLSVGGATIISLVTAGCASCGLSLISLLGLSASVSILPFHGLELHIAAVGLLIFSLWYMFKKLYEAKYCKLQ